jgi:heme-degrading monooxygenase HmoA
MEVLIYRSQTAAYHRHVKSAKNLFKKKGRRHMAVKIIIKRRVPESLATQLRPLLIKLRNLAMNQPGYITGETLKRIDRPGQNLVISTWNSMEEWRQWAVNSERESVQAQIDALLGQPTEYEIYSSE